MVVACSEPLDTATATSPACLYTRMPNNAEDNDSHRGTSTALTAHAPTTLAGANADLQRLDSALAKAIALGQVAALAVVSCDPDGANAAATRAATTTRLPVTGTGGTTVAMLAARGAHVVGPAGGSVATTHASRAVAVAAALAAALDRPYTPRQRASPWAPARLCAVFDGCLPTVLAPVVLSSCARVLGSLLPPAAARPAGVGVGAMACRRMLAVLSPAALSRAAAAGITVLGVRQLSDMGELALLTACVAAPAADGQLLAALGAAAAVSTLLPRAVATAARCSLPATAATLAAVVGVGGSVALVTAAIFAPLSAVAQRTLLAALAGAVAPGHTPVPLLLVLRAAAGAALGVAVCHGGQVGWYHRVVLPVLLLEMQGGGPALLGAHDLCALCLTGAGVCAATLLWPVGHGKAAAADAALARRGLLANLFCGDFVEAAYPFLARDVWCARSVYTGAALAGAVLHLTGARSTAYVPLPAAVALSNQPLACAAACAVAFAVPFTVTLLRNVWHL